MWIFSTNGFISAVQHRADPSKLVVRSRDWRSLEPLADYVGVKPQKAIKIGGGTDYPYRMVVDRGTLASYAAMMVEQVTYDNFKDAMTSPKGRGKGWSRPLMDVWTAMLQVTPAKARRRQRLEDSKLWASFRDYREDDPPLEYDPDERDLNSMPLHSLTQAEWEQLMEETPHGR